MEAEVEAERQMETHGLESQPVGDEGNSSTREEGRKWTVNWRLITELHTLSTSHLQRKSLRKKKNWNTFGKNSMLIQLTHPLCMIFSGLSSNTQILR